MDWAPEPHNVDPAIAVAVDHIQQLLRVPDALSPTNVIAAITGLTPDRLEALGGVPTNNHSDTGTIATPLINARDCELAGFNLADVMAAYKANAR